MKRIAFFGGSFDPPHRGHLAIAHAAAERFMLDRVLFAPVGRQPLKSAEKTAEEPSAFIHRYAMTVLATQADARFVPSLLDRPRVSPGRVSLDQDRPHAAPTYTPNYTIDALMAVHASLAAYGESYQLFTLLGADSWLDIGRWNRAAELLGLSDWIVAPRPGFSLDDASAGLPVGVKSEQAEDSTLGHHLVLRPPGRTKQDAETKVTRVWFLPHLKEDISATELRFTLSAMQHGSGQQDRAQDRTIESVPVPPNLARPGSPAPHFPRSDLARLLPPGVMRYIQDTGLYGDASPSTLNRPATEPLA